MNIYDCIWMAPCRDKEEDTAQYKDLLSRFINIDRVLLCWHFVGHTAMLNHPKRRSRDHTRCKDSKITFTVKICNWSLLHKLYNKAIGHISLVTVVLVAANIAPLEIDITFHSFTDNKCRIYLNFGHSFMWAW